jgi:hypothetical protein
MVEQVDRLFTILHIPCSGCTENWLSNSSLITILHSFLIENILEWWKEVSYYLNTSMMQNTVRNSAMITTWQSFRGETRFNLLQQTWTLVKLCWLETARLCSIYDCFLSRRPHSRYVTTVTTIWRAEQVQHNQLLENTCADVEQKRYRMKWR